MKPTGVLLVNLGSPDDPSIRSVRRYLDEFLGDRYVIDTPRLLWWLVRKLVILPTRPKRSAHAYAKIWTDEGSPLIAVSQRQRAALATVLGDGYRVALGMRYGNPSIEAGVRELADAGCERFVFLPMFPQVTKATNGTALVATKAAAARHGLQLIEADLYFEDPGYVEPLAARLEAAVARAQPDHVVLSFHGLPEKFVEEGGDPYREHCEATATAVAKRAGLGDGDWTLTYQSRFGREEWLKPATAEVVDAMAQTHPRLVVACPGFPADCLETLEEIGLTGRSAFRAAGGEHFELVECLNDDPAWIDGMAAIVRRSA